MRDSKRRRCRRFVGGGRERSDQAAALTTNVTVEPAAAIAAGSGSCEITKPAGTLASGSDSMLTSSPARFRIVTASLRASGGCETLGTLIGPVGSGDAVVVDAAVVVVIDVVVGLAGEVADPD